MHRTMNILAAALTTAALLPIAFSHAARAQDFFAGKTISMSTHSTAGAGYDAYLRLLSRHMGRHIPGRELRRHQSAGRRRAARVNYAARAAPQDGTFLTIVSQGLLVIEATGGRGLQASLGTFKWLGNFSQSNNVTVTWTTSKRRRLAGCHGARRHGGRYWRVCDGRRTDFVQFLLGTRFKIIQGYSGSGHINLAMQRGELDGHANSTWTSIKTTLNNEFRDGKLNVLIQMGLRKEPELPDVPLLSDLVTGDPKKEAVAKFMSLAVSVARPFAAPPGVPDDRVALLRRAFDATMKDPEFLAEAKKLNSDIDPVSGEETQVAIAGILSTPKSVIAEVQAALAGSPN